MNKQAKKTLQRRRSNLRTSTENSGSSTQNQLPVQQIQEIPKSEPVEPPQQPIQDSTSAQQQQPLNEGNLYSIPEDQESLLDEYIDPGADRCVLGVDPMLKMKQISLYGRDYKIKDIGQSNLQANLKVDSFAYSQNPVKATVEYQSVHQAEYKKLPLVDQRYRRPMDYIQQPFHGLSSYFSQYVDWKQQEAYRQGHGGQQTVLSQLPFMGSSLYTDSYVNQGFLKQPTAKPKDQSPLPKLPGFLGKSTKQTDFDDKSVYSSSYNGGLVTNPDNFFQIPAYSGQYKSINKTDFDDKSVILKSKGGSKQRYQDNLKLLKQRMIEDELLSNYSQSRA